MDLIRQEVEDALVLAEGDIEAKPARRPRLDEEQVARAEQHSGAHPVLGQLGAVADVGMARPQVQSSLRLVEQLKAERRQSLADAPVRFRQAVAQRLQMLAPAALGQR